MTNKVSPPLSKSLRWAWKEGKVDVWREHIKISYGNWDNIKCEESVPVALIAPPKRNVFTVQFILNPANLSYMEILGETKNELDFYLVEKGELKPWNYAIYHCTSSANAYSSIHWAYYRRGEQKTGGKRANMNHSECVRKLIEAGTKLGFKAVGKSSGRKYHLGNPDCVWYYAGKGHEVFGKIARGEKAKYLPFIAFEVAYSEKEKNLRGSLVTLQLINASANIIVLLRKSVEHKEFLKKLLGRYSFGRFRLWLEKDVHEIYGRVVNM